jgi:hypothetical protein
LHRALGIKAERVPLSSASGYQANGADVDTYALTRTPHRFFFTLEAELLSRRRFASQAEAKMACFS